MEWLISFLESQYCSNLLYALLHSLWQGPLIAAILYIFLKTKIAKGENARYIAGLIAMAAIVLCVLFTFSILNYEPVPIEIPVFTSTNQQVNTTDVETSDNIVQSEPIEVQSVSKVPLITSASSTRKADFNWKPLVLTLWFVGVVIMLLRAMYLIAGGAKLRSGCNALKDERVLEIIEKLRKRMKITRKIRVAVSEQISIPGVIGFVRTVLFLPASMLSNMPIDALEAILAHELAHIKRYDYLVNFCQMVVEAILFFNPAVWWISRQIRIEREVCCDNAGIATIGRRIRYAEVLVGWAKKLQQPDMELSMAAMGFGNPDNHGSMAERIKRIVTTDHKPALKASWHTAGMTLLLSFIAIGCLCMGADVTVAVAGKILSPEERIDRITEISEDYGYSEYKYGEDKKIQISGTIKTWDNKPLPENTSISLRIERGIESIGNYIDISTDGPLAAMGTFNQEINYGTVYMLITADGYAPITAGPLYPEPEENLEDLEYILQKGYPATIKVVDDNNELVEKVKITGGYKISPRTYYLAGAAPYVSLTTDANGIATIDNMINIETSLTFDADGFELYNTTDFILKPDEINVIKLTSSRETNGIVVSKATGEPIKGAKLWIVASENTMGNDSCSYGRFGEPETVTDENGSFRLRKLHSDYRYFILVEAEGYMRQHLSDVKAGTDKIMVELGPEKSINGKIIGDLETLKKDKNDTPVITYRQMYMAGDDRVAEAPEKANVTIENGIGYFEIEKCAGQAVGISAGDRNITVVVDEDDLDNVLIDLSPEVTSTREVVLKFQLPEDEPDIEGKVLFDYSRLEKFTLTSNWPGSMSSPMKEDRLGIEIIDNQTRVEVPAPGTFSFSIDIDNGNRAAGYWFDNPKFVDIPDGDDPYIIEIPVYPAGAIYGTIRRPDGTIIDDAQISVKAVELPKDSMQGNFNRIINSETDRGTFNATPLPLGGKYGIIAYEGKSYGVSEIIEINEKNPIVNIDIDVPDGVDLHGRLVDADGNPLRNPVTIVIDINRGEISYGVSGPGIWPDKDGRFVYENVNPGPYGKCSITVKGAKGYQPAEHEIKDLSEPILIQLEKGLRATGVVVDEDTGLPIPGVEVSASRKIKQNGIDKYERIEAEEPTNEKGEFVFTCMNEGTYRLYLSLVGYYINSNYKITGGQDEPAIYKFSMHKPSDKPTSSGQLRF